MQGRELRYRRSMRIGDTIEPPCVKPLVGQVEMLADQRRTDLLDQRGMGVLGFSHAPLYQRSFDTASAFDLIAAQINSFHIRGMSFAERLTAAWKAAGFKSERQAALACGLSPQRFNNYTNPAKGIVPDPGTLHRIARALKTTPGALLAEEIEEGLRDILVTLLGLEGVPADRADALANAVIEAKRLLEVLPDEAPLPQRASLAAHAAWRTQQPPAHGL